LEDRSGELRSAKKQRSIVRSNDAMPILRPRVTAKAVPNSIWRVERDPNELPPDLPRPRDDGAVAHLPGATLPAIALASTSGADIRLDLLDAGRVVLYAYPRTGRPGEANLTDDWDLIPGARGCTPQACAFRDHHAELARLGARVFGISTQDSDYQREAAGRLHLPFELLSDSQLLLTEALRLPILTVAGHTLLKRHTLIVRAGVIEHVFFPVFPPDQHAGQVLTWLSEHP
jgi:peroxiredoxin